MRPETTGPWRKGLRAQGRKRQPRASRRCPIQPDSTWRRRHLWLPWDERLAVYQANVRHR